MRHAITLTANPRQTRGPIQDVGAKPRWLSRSALHLGQGPVRDLGGLLGLDPTALALGVPGLVRQLRN